MKKYGIKKKLSKEIKHGKSKITKKRDAKKV